MSVEAIHPGAFGDSGAVVTNDAGLAEKVRRLRNHGMHPKYYHAEVGGNFRMAPIQAVALSVKLPHLDRWHRMRRENAAHYDAHLRAPGLTTPTAKWGREHHIYNQYVVRSTRREELRKHLAARGVGHEIYYPVPLHLQECFRSLGYQPGSLPETERAAREVLSLPIYPELTSPEQQAVVSRLRDIVARPANRAA